MGTPDHDRAKEKPYLIERDAAGEGFILTVRETRFNSQNYPIVTATRVDEAFRTAAAARAFAKAEYDAQPGEFASK